MFVLLPDGVGLRNYAFSGFVEKAKKQDIELKFWNNTKFDLSQVGLNSVQVPRNKIHILSDYVKKAKIELTLTFFANKYNNKAYLSYQKLSKNGSLKNCLKNSISYTVKILLTPLHPKSLQQIINFLESRTSYYSACREQLVKERPDVILCTNQRNLSSVAPLLAARSLGIPTVSMIFSWDNLPKATLIVDSDYYFVWSDYMKHELINYYSIAADKIKVTGTTQFEPYFDQNNIIPQSEFYSKYKLREGIRYICFSGDDVTTSPYDPNYLRDLAEYIEKYNSTYEVQFGIIFRRCPVDKSNRFDSVLEKYKNIIYPVDPDWSSHGGQWNEVMALPGDIKLLVSTVFYSECVFNLGSTMVFDFVSLSKPCFYINYDPEINSVQDWSVEKIYKYIHFNSMPSENSVGWVNKKSDYFNIILSLAKGQFPVNLSGTKKWFETVVKHPAISGSDRMLNELRGLCKKKT